LPSGVTTQFWAEPGGLTKQLTVPDDPHSCRSFLKPWVPVNVNTPLQ